MWKGVVNDVLIRMDLSLRTNLIIRNLPRR
jgi:hypothetical protein